MIAAKSSWIPDVMGLRSRGAFESTMGLLGRVLDESPTDPLVHYHIAWTHDALGKERDAVAHYEKAIELGLDGEDLKSAYLGLGSTYRAMGDYEKAEKVFETAVRVFPDDRALRVFQGLTLANRGLSTKAIEILLKQLVETTNDESIKTYSRALLFYSDKLDQTFE